MSKYGAVKFLIWFILYRFFGSFVASLKRKRFYLIEYYNGDVFVFVCGFVSYVWLARLALKSVVSIPFHQVQASPVGDVIFVKNSILVLSFWAG